MNTLFELYFNGEGDGRGSGFYFPYSVGAGNGCGYGSETFVLSGGTFHGFHDEGCGWYDLHGDRDCPYLMPYGWACLKLIGG